MEAAAAAALLAMQHELCSGMGPCHMIPPNMLGQLPNVSSCLPRRSCEREVSIVMLLQPRQPSGLTAIFLHPSCGGARWPW